MTGEVWLARGEEWEQWIPPHYETWWEVADGACFLDHPAFPAWRRIANPAPYVDVVLHHPRHTVAQWDTGDMPPGGRQPYERKRFEWRGKMRGACPLLEEMT